MEFIVSRKLGGASGHLSKTCRRIARSLPLWAKKSKKFFGKKIILKYLGEYGGVTSQDYFTMTVNPEHKNEAVVEIFGDIIRDSIYSDQKILERATHHFNLIVFDERSREVEIKIFCRHLALYIWQGGEMKTKMPERHLSCQQFFKDMERFEGAR